ncbi:hypothetical protein [Natrinema versiforme]|uniref:Uncharacterized protein n=1 Tax=Natrinema versiforme TaxID=88724 RepID=A0A4P8WRK1_9EURY|nr:hypothetical protein [Natrinema versiforme]QCS44751.1 hypothetical protein FEJ81_20980 [Natrinema versiforme]
MSLENIRWNRLAVILGGLCSFLLGVSLLSAYILEPEIPRLLYMSALLILTGIVPVGILVATIVRGILVHSIDIFHRIIDILSDYRIRSINFCKSNVSVVVFVMLFLSLVLIIYTYKEMPSSFSSGLIVIVPATVYYIYTEFLDQPSVLITSEVNSTVIPVTVPLHKEELKDFFNRGSIRAGPDAAGKFNPDNFTFEIEEGVELQLIKRGPILRPVVFQTVELENVGSATAEDAMIEFRVLDIPIDNNTFYGRWVTPDSPQHYDLLPGQSHEVSFSKTYITTRFFAGMGIVNTYQYPYDNIERDHFAYHPSISPEKGPSGALEYLPIFDSGDIDPRFFVPKEEAEKNDVIVETEQWNGREIIWNDKKNDREYEVEARVLADNYRSPWCEIETISIPTGPILDGLTNDNWHEVWEKPIYKELPPDIQDSIREWQRDGMAINRYAKI